MISAHSTFEPSASISLPSLDVIIVADTPATFVTSGVRCFAWRQAQFACLCSDCEWGWCMHTKSYQDLLRDKCGRLYACDRSTPSLGWFDFLFIWGIFQNIFPAFLPRSMVPFSLFGWAPLECSTTAAGNFCWKFKITQFASGLDVIHRWLYSELPT